ncbi:hypothetical protein Tco_1293995 [Tanacetum coccineum]
MLKKRRQKRRRLKMIKLALSFQRYNGRKLKHRSQALASYYLLLNMVTTKITPTPSTTSPTTEAQVTPTSISDPPPTVLLRLSELEKKIDALSKINQSEMIKESVQANVTNEVRNQVPKLLPRAVSDFILPEMESKYCVSYRRI